MKNSNLSDIGALISNQMVTINIQPDELVEVNIDISQKGLYLLLFQIVHCGGNDIISTNPFWTISGFEENNGGMHRKYISIPIAKSWDDVCGSCCCMQYLESGTHTFTFTNNTGIATNSVYTSSFTVTAVKLK